MELRLPQNADARELLTAHFDVVPARPPRAVATFYDTFDGRLRGGVGSGTCEGRLSAPRPGDGRGARGRGEHGGEAALRL